MAEESHDVRLVLPGGEVNPPIYGDFEPTASEPDLAVWPHPSDVGYDDFGGDPADLHLVTNTVPEPHVRWITAQQHREEFGYSPGPENAAPALRNWEIATIRDQAEPAFTLTEDRLEAFHRLADLWNGQLVGPKRHHLLVEKPPQWADLFADLDGLAALTPKASRVAIANAFGCFDWCTIDPAQDAFLTTQHIVRRKVKYAPTQKAKTLINGQDDLPTLRGDPFEALKHRFGVGTAAAYFQFCCDGDVRTYVDIDGYTIDVVRDEADTRVLCEVLTAHNNYKLYRDTYWKLESLDEEAFLVFDSRETAYRVFNHWASYDLVDLPVAPFTSAPRLEWARKKTREAYTASECDWVIADWQSITSLWQATFGPEGPQPNKYELTSLEW